MHLVPVVVVKNLNVVVANNYDHHFKKDPENTKESEIIKFISPILKGSFFNKTGHIESIKILTLKDKQRNTIEHHGLVTIDSDAAAKRVIKQLNRKPFKNKNITIREYFYRSWHNDPRVNMGQWNEELENKRKGSRRRPRLEIVTEESIKFSSKHEDHHKL